jgi:hypothetical protein
MPPANAYARANMSPCEAKGNGVDTTIIVLDSGNE